MKNDKTNITRDDIVKYLLETDLITVCVQCQLHKKKADLHLEEDLIQDIWEWVMTYDENKLIDAFTNKHLNALITRTLINNVFSVNSPYYKKYHKFTDKTTEITLKELNIPDNEQE